MHKAKRFSAVSLIFILLFSVTTFTAKADSQSISGIALKAPTNIYSRPSTSNSTVIKQYSQGTLLKYQSYNSGWYICEVYVNGKLTTGYINVNDVESPVANPQSLKGVALEGNTAIYQRASKDSTKIKSYDQGTLLRFETFISGWYECEVYVNGKLTTGYINASDVEIPVSNQQALKGVALGNPTNIYLKASTNSTILKSYDQGTILSYETFITGWYVCKVYVNGKLTTGYINAGNVENSVANPEDIIGVGLKNPTKIYSKATTNSDVLKSYEQGKILKYESFVSGWYKCEVYINGKLTPGYISENDVENSDANSHEEIGVGLKSQTNIYLEASTNSRILKSYDQGTVLHYETFTTGWYKCEVYINGRLTTGYISATDVENSVDSPKSYEGIGIKSPTNIYSKATRTSVVLKSYIKGTLLHYKTFVTGWFTCTVSVNGKTYTGYINVNDVSPPKVYKNTAYNTTLDNMVNKQLGVNPQTDETIGFIVTDAITNIVGTTGTIQGDGSGWYVHSSASTSSSRIDSLYNGDEVRILKTVHTTDSSYPDWYEIEYNSGSWGAANSTEVSYYVDPSNFSKDSSDYFQFLKLSGAAGLDENEANSVLIGKGILSNKGSSFIKAANENNINEVYLISHALLETGNGTSTLANGVRVKKVYDSSGQVVVDKYGYIQVEIVNDPSSTDFDAIVYNMYGIGATDVDALHAGAKMAFNKGWTSPESAIIGGAEWISEYYVNNPNRVQDTLYKMRWNPASPATHQYASDIAWAVKQTDEMNTLYNLLKIYNPLIFDTPVYN